MAAKVPSVLLFTLSSFNASAAVRFVTSVLRSVVNATSAAVALVTSPARLVVKVNSAPVALVTSDARSSVVVFMRASNILSAIAKLVAPDI